MTEHAQGFLRPTTTPTPDEIFDIWLPVLSGSELKVLLYIVRRTFGFQKDADAISLRQICEGITTRDGRVLDRGTGLARSSASKAVKDLEERGLITVDRVQDASGEFAVNVYTLRFSDETGDDPHDDPAPDQGGPETPPPPDREPDRGSSKTEPPTEPTPEQAEGSPKSEPPPVRKSNHPGSEIELRVVRKSNPQQTELQETDRQQTGSQQTESVHPPPESKPPPPEPPQPEMVGGGGGTDAVQALVDFGVWRSRAEKLSREYGLTLSEVASACDALRREQRSGASMTSPAAVLVKRLAEGWRPSPAKTPDSEPDGGGGAGLVKPAPQSPSLPPIRDRRGVERDVHQMAESLLELISHRLPQVVFDTRLRRISVSDYRPEQDLLTLRIPDRASMDWVRIRLLPLLQRELDRLVATPTQLELVGPEEASTSSAWTAPAGQAQLQAVGSGR